MIWLLPCSPSLTFCILNRTSSFQLQGASLSLDLEAMPSALLCLEFLLLQSPFNSIFSNGSFNLHKWSCFSLTGHLVHSCIPPTVIHTLCLFVYCLSPKLGLSSIKARTMSPLFTTNIWRTLGALQILVE